MFFYFPKIQALTHLLRDFLYFLKIETLAHCTKKYHIFFFLPKHFYLHSPETGTSKKFLHLPKTKISKNSFIYLLRRIFVNGCLLAKRNQLLFYL